ncbi:MAG: hypothetical protein ACK4GW_14300 [Pseudorhodobacter sp.]
MENVTGTSFGDTPRGDGQQLQGGTGANWPTGGAGNDRLEAGHGFGIAHFAHARDEYTITRTGADTIRASHSGGGRHDGPGTPLPIEMLWVSDGNYLL